MNIKRQVFHSLIFFHYFFPLNSEKHMENKPPAFFYAPEKQESRRGVGGYQNIYPRLNLKYITSVNSLVLKPNTVQEVLQQI